MLREQIYSPLSEPLEYKDPGCQSGVSISANESTNETTHSLRNKLANLLHTPLSSVENLVALHVVSNQQRASQSHPRTHLNRQQALDLGRALLDVLLLRFATVARKDLDREFQVDVVCETSAQVVQSSERERTSQSATRLDLQSVLGVEACVEDCRVRAFGEGDSHCQLLCVVLRPLVDFEAVPARRSAFDDEIKEQGTVRDVAHVVELRNLRHHDGEIRKSDQVDEGVAEACELDDAARAQVGTHMWDSLVK